MTMKNYFKKLNKLRNIDPKITKEYKTNKDVNQNFLLNYTNRNHKIIVLLTIP